MKTYHRPTELIGNKEKAVLHIAKQDLKLSRDEYEAVLLGAGGVDSSTKLTWAKYGRVLDRLKELGFKMKGGAGAEKGKRPFREPVSGKRHAPHAQVPGYFLQLASPEQQAKIFALWQDGARINTPKALDHFIKRMTGKDSIRFITLEEARQVIESLKKMFCRPPSKGEKR